MEINLFGEIIVEEEAFEPKAQSKNPFEFNQAISDKNYPDDVEGYNAWLTNGSFSQRKDTALYANEMNYYHQLSDRAQFDFYYYSLPKKKYFAKWAKAVKSDYTEMIMEYFNVSLKVAKQYEKILRNEEIAKIKTWHENKKGGK